MYDIIIIGAGPAGLTAAIYARRASKKVLVIEAKSYGGQIITTLDIENYPAIAHISGFDLATGIYKQANDLGAEIIFEKVIDIKDNKDVKEVITKQNTYKSKAIILATGSDNRKLKIEKEEEFVGKGISYCATCDGAFYKGKIVAVVGGGNTALEDALYLSDIASKVYLIHRRDEFRAEESTINNLNKKLQSIEVTDNKKDKKNIEIDGLFVAVGRIPENQNFAKLINLDKSGYVIAGEDCNTNVPGIFVAGDNRTKRLRQLVTATSDGAVAATAAISYINSLRK